MEEIVNRVSKSPLKSVDLEDYLDTSDRVGFDLKDVLFQGMILREKDFRQFVKDHDWSQYEGKNVYIFCSSDAIIPSWSFMLLMAKLQPVVNEVVVGSEADLEKVLIDQAIDKILQEDYSDEKVVIKGCGNVSNREYAYGQFAKKLLPYVSSLMYGEPCSTVPIYKKPRK
jgi:hypothetical protein